MFLQKIIFWHTKKYSSPSSPPWGCKESYRCNRNETSSVPDKCGRGILDILLKLGVCNADKHWLSACPGRFYHFWWQHEGGYKGVGLISPSCNSLEVQAARREWLPLYSVESERSPQRGIHPLLHGCLRETGQITPEGALSLQSPPTTAEGPHTTTIDLMPVTSQMRRIPPETLSKQCHLRMTQLNPLFHHVLCVSALLVYIIRQRTG